MKLLVTGGTGFLGSHLAQELNKLGLDITYMVRGSASRLPFPGRTIDSSLGDELDFTQLRDITHVINCAAQAKWGDDAKTYQTNVLATGSFMDQLAKLPKLQRVIHVGTAFTAGVHQDCLVPESIPQAGVAQFNVYTESKNIGRSNAQLSLGKKLTVIAPSIIVGHTQNGCISSQQIWWLFDLVTKLKAFTFNLDQKIDVVPVDHVVNMIIHELLHPSKKPYIHATSGINSNTFREIYSEFDRIRGTNVVEEYQQMSLDELSKIVAAKYNRRLAKTLMNAIAQYCVFADSGITFQTAVEAPSFVSYLGICDKSVISNIGEQIRQDFTGK